VRRWRPRRFGPRTLRTRLALYAGLAAFGCLTVAGIAVFLAAAWLLGQQAEAQLRQFGSVVRPAAMLPTPVLEGACRTMTARGAPSDGGATPAAPSPGPSPSAAPGPDGGLDPAAQLAESGLVAELVRPDGTTCLLLGKTIVHDVASPGWTWHRLPGTGLPQGTGDRGEHLLVLDQPLADGWTLRLARDLSSDVEVVFALREVMFALSLIGGLAALLFGRMVARSGLRPVAALAETAEHIARTQDLSVRIDVPDRGEEDEVTRLAAAFDRMMSALAASRARQAQLVADAGHELRTPLTSLRTNIDLLLRAERSGRTIPAAQREALFEDVRSQLAELSQLAGELTVLAEQEPAPTPGPVRLDEVVAAAVRRVRPRAGGRRLDVELEPWLLADADAVGLERAVVNVLDNAIKFSPPESTVRVRLAGGTVTVDDEGPGLPPADRAEAFARFWRSDSARGLPGSGLGLAIVADAVARHGGTAELDDAPGGGARARLHLPGERPDRDDDRDDAGVARDDPGDALTPVVPPAL
jgi:two-component system, OmpR family, sensor histidine kinase MprB